jgi:hypothetical protein
MQCFLSMSPAANDKLVLPMRCDQGLSPRSVGSPRQELGEPTRRHDDRRGSGASPTTRVAPIRPCTARLHAHRRARKSWSGEALIRSYPGASPQGDRPHAHKSDITHHWPSVNWPLRTVWRRAGEVPGAVPRDGGSTTHAAPRWSRDLRSRGTGLVGGRPRGSR